MPTVALNNCETTRETRRAAKLRLSKFWGKKDKNKMDPTPENLMALSNYLRQTMSPESAARKPAEEFLRSVENQRGFPLLLLNLLGSEDSNPEMMAVKLAAAINFKNYIKRNWKIVSNLLLEFINLFLKVVKFRPRMRVTKFMETIVKQSNDPLLN